MLALVAEGAGRRPRLEDEVDAFLEVFAIERGIGVVGELLAAGAAHPSGNQAALREQIDHRELFGEAQRIGDRRHRIAEQHDLRALGRTREHRRLDIHHRAEAERRAMMLVEHQAVEAEVLGIDLLVDVLVEQHRAGCGIEVLVGQSEEAAVAQDLVFQQIAFRRFGFRIVVILPLGEPHYMHRRLSAYPRKF